MGHAVQIAEIPGAIILFQAYGDIPEQASHWDWIIGQIKHSQKPFKCTKSIWIHRYCNAGCSTGRRKVTHVTRLSMLSTGRITT